jgi:hypothetical protein
MVLDEVLILVVARRGFRDEAGDSRRVGADYVRSLGVAG